jgi:hypothetical protein
MARLSAEERRLQREAEEAQRKAEKEALRQTMPSRLMLLAALARTLNVDTDLRLIENGVSLRIRREESPYIDSTLTYDSEEWEVESVESDLNQIKAENEARAARLAMAQDVWNHKLTKEEKAALKEFIYQLY